MELYTLSSAIFLSLSLSLPLPFPLSLSCLSSQATLTWSSLHRLAFTSQAGLQMRHHPSLLLFSVSVAFSTVTSC